MISHAGEPAEYLLIDGHLQEANWYKERFRSWFVGDAVLEDGSMYLCTPVDPLFLALPLLESSRMQVTPHSACHALQQLQGPSSFDGKQCVSSWVWLTPALPQQVQRRAVTLDRSG